MRIEERTKVRWAGPAIDGAKRMLRVRDWTPSVDSRRWGFEVGARLMKHDLREKR